MSCIKKIVNRDEKANGRTLNEKSKKTQNFSQYIRRVTILQTCGTAPGLKRDKFRDYFTLTFFVLPHLPTVHTVGCHCYLLITFYCARTEIIILFHGMRANGPSHYLKCSECKFVI